MTFIPLSGYVSRSHSRKISFREFPSPRSLYLNRIFSSWPDHIHGSEYPPFPAPWSLRLKISFVRCKPLKPHRWRVVCILLDSMRIKISLEVKPKWNAPVAMRARKVVLALWGRYYPCLCLFISSRIENSYAKVRSVYPHPSGLLCLQLSVELTSMQPHRQNAWFHERQHGHL